MTPHDAKVIRCSQADFMGHRTMSNGIPDQEAMSAFAELVQLGVNRAAATLSELVGQPIEISVPYLRDQLADNGTEAASLDQPPESMITQSFHGSISGSALLSFSAPNGVALAQALSGASQDAGELDAELSGILLETGNILLNGVLSTLFDDLSAVPDYSIPELRTAARRSVGMLYQAANEADSLIGEARFHVLNREIPGTIAIVFADGSIHSLIEAVQPAAV